MKQRGLFSNKLHFSIIMISVFLTLILQTCFSVFFSCTSFAFSNSNYHYDRNNKMLYSSDGESYIYDKNGNLIFRFQSASFHYQKQLTFNNIKVNKELGGKNTTEFWMYWDGTNGVMPFSWENYYTLWFYDGSFGFNTGESNILGISSSDLKNRWVHVVAVFYNGVPNSTQNELYIDGKKQKLEAKIGTTTRTVAATETAYISGTGGTSVYNLTGRIGEVRVWNYALSELEVQSNMYRVTYGNETGLAGYWRLSDKPVPVKSASFNGSKQIKLDKLAVNKEPGEKNTVEFWMYWDGTNGIMPFSWDYYTLWFYDGSFGFNTGESNILGISSSDLKNRWVHVVAVFYNGVPNPKENELYIDGEKQKLEGKIGAVTRAVSAHETAYVSGTGGTSIYNMSGRIGELRIWNYAVSELEVKSNMYRVLHGDENKLIGYWRLSDEPVHSKSASFNGSNQIALDKLAVNKEPGKKNTVEFWMNWDGTNVGMPFSWENYYTLWFYDGSFGFNTGENNILGISSSDLKNRWVHVVAIFYNGVPNSTQNELYIDGVKQKLEAKTGTTTRVVSATERAYISGTGGTSIYNIRGDISELRIWNYALSESEIRTNVYRILNGNEVGLAGVWKP